MRNMIIAGATALSLAFAGVTPAQADQRDIARLLAGIATVAIIAKVIDDRRDRRAAVPAPPPRPRYEALPADCIVDVRTRGRDVRVLGSRCLQRNYRDFNALPQACEIELRGRGNRRSGFDIGCLRNAGFEIGRYRH